MPFIPLTPQFSRPRKIYTVNSLVFRGLLLFALAVIAASPSHCQNPPASLNLLSAPPPPPVTGLSVTAPSSGNASYWYWIVATYPAGAASPTGPVQITNVASLTAGTPAAISWTSMPGATSYSLLRRTDGNLPGGTCTGCLVVTQAGTTYSDTGTAGSNYSFTTGTSTLVNVAVDNTSAVIPRLPITFSPPLLSYFWGIVPQTATAGNCAVIGSGGQILDFGAACSSGGGGAPTGPAGGCLAGTYPNPTFSGITTAGGIPYANSTPCLTQDAANFFYDATNKRFQLGTIPVPAYDAFITTSWNKSNTTAYPTYQDVYGAYNQYVYDSTGLGTSAIDLYGTYQIANIRGNANVSTGGVTGFNALGTSSGTANVGYIYGGNFSGTAGGTSTVGDLFGFQGAANITGAAVTNATGVRARVHKVGGGTITNGYGLSVLATVDATNNWNIYSTAGTGTQARNYFGGPTGIGPGTDTPTNTLTVKDSTAVTGTTRATIVPGAGDTQDSVILDTQATHKVLQLQYGAGTEPTCNSTNRGRTVMVQGGAGVADTYRICQKDAADAYAWVALPNTVTASEHIIGGTFASSDDVTALVAGQTSYFTFPYACTIRAWNITVSPSGTVAIDIWKNAVGSGTAIPTVANTITASATPAISTGTKVHSTTLTGWTTTVTANDTFGINLKTVGGSPTYANLTVECY